MDQFDSFLKLVEKDPNLIITNHYKDKYFICKTRTGPRRFVKIPLRLTPNLAYFVGAMLGDGYINKSEFGFGIDKGNKEYLENIFLPLIKELFDLKLKVISVKTWWRILTRSKGLWLLLTNVFSLPAGKRKNVRVPAIILDSSKEIKSFFVAGILDTDGGKRGGGFGFTSASKQFNEEIIYMLKELGISPFPQAWFNKTYSREYYGWRIKSKSELRRLLKTIPLKNQKRLEILSNLCRGAGVVKRVGFRI